MSHSLPRRLTAAALALSLALPVVSFASDTARAQETCTTFRAHPLWVTSVDLAPAGPEAPNDTRLEEAPYVESGERVALEVTVENRFPEACLQETGELTNELRLKLWYAHGGEHHNETEALSCQDTSGRSSLQAGETCTLTRRLPGHDGHVQGPAGEQRVRMLVFDDDADDDLDDRPDDCAGATTDLDPGQQGACAGAERVLVVDRLPDLTIDGIAWLTPERERHTTYHRAPSAFEARIGNDGAYPNWDPNGPEGPNDFWGRSSYDGDGDGAPDAEGAYEDGEEAYDYRHDLGPPCRWQANPEQADGGEQFRCSYRRGRVLDTPLHHRVHSPDDGAEVANGTSPVYQLTDEPMRDKDEALLPGETTDHRFEALDRYKRAGAFQLSAEVARSADERLVPESSEDNNDARRPADLLGVDLAITEPRVVVDTPDGVRESCPASDPCPLASAIRVDPAYRNVGDEALDADPFDPLREIPWVATVYLDGENVTWARQDEVPRSEANATDPEPVFAREQTLRPRPGGGLHELAIRLDHPDNYEGRQPAVTDDRGVVGERDDGRACPGPDEPANNTYCASLWFDDHRAPSILDLGIERPPNETTRHVEVGEPIRFTAVVEDTSRVDVTAVFEDEGSPATLVRPDGSAFSELAMQPVEGANDTYAAEARIAGPAGSFTYHVRAEDSAHERVSEPVGFAVHEDLADLRVYELEVERTGLGEHRVDARVGNEGGIASGAADVELEACPEQGPLHPGPLADCQTLLATTAPDFDAGAIADYRVSWDTLEELGRWEVCARADPVEDGRERVEANNEDCRTVDLGPA